MNTSGVEKQSDKFIVSSRKIIAEGSDVHVKEFTLAPNEQVPWHHHTDVFDVFYCLEGGLVVERIDLASKQRLEDLVLKVGESVKVEPGTAHRPFNAGSSVCRFLLVQGVGQYDFIPYRVSDKR